MGSRSEMSRIISNYGTNSIQQTMRSICGKSERLQECALGLVFAVFALSKYGVLEKSGGAKRRSLVSSTKMEATLAILAESLLRCSYRNFALVP